MPIGSGFLVLSRDNFAYSLSARNGTLRWKKRLPGRVAHFVVSDGKLLVSTLDQHGASLVDISTGRLVGQIPFQSDEELVTDPVALDKRFVVATGRAISSFAPGICSIK
jgi:outer membrane protein assembly factor BamB